MTYRTELKQRATEEMNKNMPQYLQDLELDAKVCLHLLGGHTLVGYLNDWDWADGIINLRRKEDDQKVQYWVPVESVVAFTTYQPK